MMKNKSPKIGELHSKFFDLVSSLNVSARNELSKSIFSISFIIVWCCSFHCTLGQTQNDTIAIRTAISNYYQGLQQNDKSLARKAFDDRLIFFNGNHSDSPTQWQPHMYLHGGKINSWLDFMIKEAGPHQNSIEFKLISLRGRSALVVTNENGNNKFRSWTNELVVWNLGFRKGSWRIVSVFIKELSNP